METLDTAYILFMGENFIENSKRREDLGQPRGSGLGSVPALISARPSGLASNMSSRSLDLSLLCLHLVYSCIFISSVFKIDLLYVIIDSSNVPQVLIGTMVTICVKQNMVIKELDLGTIVFIDDFAFAAKP